MAARRHRRDDVERATGFTFVRQGSGSHVVYRAPNGYVPIAIPLGHPGGVAEPILRLACRLGEVPWDVFRREL